MQVALTNPGYFFSVLNDKFVLRTVAAAGRKNRKVLIFYWHFL
jgi:hypothetical protein